MARQQTTVTAVLTLVTLFSNSPSRALQVSPNSPCARECLDAPHLDVSDPNSSSTLNSDIVCQDADYNSNTGTKFMSCMSCLQKSSFAQGSESDVKWFLYNLRYKASYCIFGFPNGTAESSPCTTSRACGVLQESIQHGIPDPRSTTAYSYCSAGNGEAMDPANFDSCIQCISAEHRTDYLANSLIALQAGCEQQPAPGTGILGLNGTVFTKGQIQIVDPSTLEDDGGSEGPVLPTSTIIGIAAGSVALLLLLAAVTFVCVRRRQNKRTREIKSRRHTSSLSFQCQTHILSPRFWPGVNNPGSQGFPQPDSSSGVWQAPQHVDEALTSGNSVHDDIETASTATTATTKKHGLASLPSLHHLTTTVPPPPSPPPQAHTSTSPSSDFNSPLSATESVRSTSPLLPPPPPGIRKYNPAEYGVLNNSPLSPPSGSSSTFSSPISTSGMGFGLALSSPGSRLDNGSVAGWTDQRLYHAPSPAPPRIQTPSQSPGLGVFENPAVPEKMSERKTTPPPARPASSDGVKSGGGSVFLPPPPPTLPTLKTSRSSGLLTAASGVMLKKKGSGSPMPGSPVESVEIKTKFEGPPRR